MREKEKESKHVIVEKAVEDAELDSSSTFHYARYFCCQRFCFLNYKTRIVGQIWHVSAIIPWLFLGIRITNGILALLSGHDEFDIMNWHNIIVSWILLYIIKGAGLIHKEWYFHQKKENALRLAKGKAWTSVWKDIQCRKSGLGVGHVSGLAAFQSDI